MVRPPQSPDLNSIENFWKTLGGKDMVRNSIDTEDLWMERQEEWAKITVEDCQRLILSRGRRYAAAIEGKGLFTKY